MTGIKFFFLDILTVFQNSIDSFTEKSLSKLIYTDLMTWQDQKFQKNVQLAPLSDHDIWPVFDT